MARLFDRLLHITDPDSGLPEDQHISGHYFRASVELVLLGILTRADIEAEYNIPANDADLDHLVNEYGRINITNAGNVAVNAVATEQARQAFMTKLESIWFIAEGKLHGATDATQVTNKITQVVDALNARYN